MGQLTHELYYKTPGNCPDVYCHPPLAPCLWLFLELQFGNNYRLISTGHGLLADNKFEKISDDLWEMDCKWTLKQR